MCCSSVPNQTVVLILWQQANVIIHNNCPRLSEYGLDSVLTNPDFDTADTPGTDGIGKWLAPEITALTSGGDKPVEVSKPTDVFAFAMLAVEVFTGEAPWGETTKVKLVTPDIKRGLRPSKPAEVGEEMWDLIQSCWSQDPNSRPVIGNVVKKLKELVNSPGRCAIPRGY